MGALFVEVLRALNWDKSIHSQGFVFSHEEFSALGILTALVCAQCYYAMEALN